MTGPSTTPSARTYQVTSLERGLGILRVVRNANEPVRNREIVSRTGLPKATVSRLVHTLTVLGYLRRIDQGSYVLGQTSSKTGRAMLEGLRLDRYGPLFQEFMRIPESQVTLSMHVQDKLMPVFRWSAAGSEPLTSDANIEPTPDALPMTACFEHLDGASREPEAWADLSDIHRQLADTGWCYQWHAGTHQLTAGIGVRISAVALCVLVVNLPQADCPIPEQLAYIGDTLHYAADSISQESPDNTEAS